MWNENPFKFGDVFHEFKKKIQIDKEKNNSIMKIQY